MNHLRFYAVGIAAVLISAPMYAAMQAQPQHLKLVSANAVLTRGLNTKSSRQGQTVTAKLTDNVTTAGTMELPKGTMLMGAVEQVQPGNANGSKSEISIVFNEARLKDGREIPIKATLLGAYPPAADYSSGGGVGSYLPIQPRLIPSDQSVIQDPGTLGNVTMKSAVQSDVSGTFLSTKDSIKLSPGMQLQLAIAPESSSSSGVSGS
ncbi:MAG: hypothetical protein ACYCO5_05835 [Acidobacteriaceae bacterium]